MIWVAEATVTVCIACDEEPTDIDCMHAICEEVLEGGRAALSFNYDEGGQITRLDDVPEGWLDSLPRRLAPYYEGPEETVRELHKAPQ